MPTPVCDRCFQSHLTRDPESAHYRLEVGPLTATPDQPSDSDLLLRDLSRMETQLLTESMRVQGKLDRLEKDMIALVHMHVENKRSEFRCQVNTVRRELSTLKEVVTRGKSKDAVVAAFLANPGKGLEALNATLDSLNFSLEEAFTAFKAIKLVDLKSVSDLFYEAYFVRIRVEMAGKPTVELHTSRDTSVYQLKEMYEQETHLSARKVQFSLNTVPLEGCRRIDELTIPDGAVITATVAEDSSTIIYIQPNQEDRFPLSFDLSDSVGLLKARISAAMDLPVANLRLVYLGHNLRDTETVSTYSIKPNSTIFLAFASRQLLRLAVKIPSGKLVPVDIPNDETVSKLKQVLAELTEIPVGKQHILSEGKELHNGHTLDFCGVKTESVLELSTADKLFDSLASLQLFVRRKLHGILNA